MFNRKASILHVALLMAYAWLALSGPAMAQSTDPDLTKVDNDSNGLIEIYTLSDLNNMRHDLAGTSYKTSEDDATPDTSGCPTPGNPVDHDGDSNTPALQACYGYELMNNLDFDTNGDSTVTATDSGGAYWNEGAGWIPIGNIVSPFVARFEGNNHTIANLYISRTETAHVGLFGAIDDAAISNLGLIGANVTGNIGGANTSGAGSLAGRSLDSAITASYAVASVSGGHNVGGLVGESDTTRITACYAVSIISADGTAAGGLVGWNDLSARITASYAVATVSGEDQVGGLVGRNDTSARIIESYAVATVLGNNIAGGLVGLNWGSITASYAVATVSSNSGSGGGLRGAFLAIESVSASYFNTDFTAQEHSDYGKTTSELRMPIEYGTGDAIYATWDTANDPWDFGTARQYPGLNLFQFSDGGCPSAPAGIRLTEGTNTCIYRPLAIPAFVSDFKSNEADDSGHSNTDRITNVSNTMIRGQINAIAGMAVASSNIRIIRLPEGSGTVIDTATDSSSRFAAAVALSEGLNRFVIEVRQAGEYWRLLETLEITLDRTSPTITVEERRGSDGRVVIPFARDGETAVHSLEYQLLSADDAQTCRAGFRGDALMEYTEPLALDALGEGEVYCFVATDLAGNIGVESSADAVPAALRLRLRVFLESALP